MSVTPFEHHAATPGQPQPWLVAALAVGFGWAVVSFLYVWGMWSTVARLGPDDTDVMMRLIEVRDLIGGQAWFDTTQYRMNAPDGFVMHWSRLVDAPIAAVIFLAEPWLGRATAETLAMTVWPLALALPFLALSAVIAYRLAGGIAAALAVAFAASAPASIAHFRVGGIDHHNVQLVGLMAALVLLIACYRTPRAGLALGAVLAGIIAIGLETLPLVVGTIGLLALGFVIDPARFAAPLRGMGAALAGVSVVLYLATVQIPYAAPSVCDAISPLYLALAVAGGGGVTLIAAMGLGSAAARVAALGLLGVGLAGGAVLMAPECLGGPLHMLDAQLKTLWFDHVAETQPVWALIGLYPGKEVVAKFVVPVLVLIGMAIAWRRAETGEARWTWAVGGLMLAAATLLAATQIRYGAFSIALAAPFAAVLAVHACTALANGGVVTRVVGRAAVIAALWPFTWTILGAAVVDPLLAPKLAAEKDAHAEAAQACFAPPAYARLNALPDGIVVNAFNLGTSILLHTRHSVIAGNYHRNTHGMRDVIDAFMGEPEAAKAIIDRRGAHYIATCKGDFETRNFGTLAPNGLLARLVRGEAIAWAKPIDTTGDILIWQVVR